MSQSFRATDDYAVTGGQATIALDLEAVDRRFGLTRAPEPREPLIVDLPMPFAGDRAEFEEAMIDDFSQHPWANLPVTLTMEVRDALGQTGVSDPREMVLPGRRFFQPVARAVIEQRRDLLWSKDNARRVADVLKAIAHRPEDGLIRSETSYLRLRVITRRLDAMAEFGIDDAGRDEIAEALWELAVQLEDGTLADARERLRRAQERLAEAMRNGASDEEIAELMQELREAVNDYTRMLAEQSQPGENGTDQPETAQGESFEFTQDELQALMDRIQELMEEGRMAEAQELMEQLNQLMENMQVTQGEGGQGQQSPGQQSMQDLSETLRDQQGLSDDAFRDLQEQFGQGQPGQQPGQPGQQPGQPSRASSSARISSKAAATNLGKSRARARTAWRRAWQSVSAPCAKNWTASVPSCPIWAARRPRARARPWTALMVPWKRPRMPCGRAIWPRRSTASQKRWKRCARASAIWAGRWPKTVRSSPDRARPRATSWGR